MQECREKRIGDIWMIKVGLLAWKLCSGKLIVRGVVLLDQSEPRDLPENNSRRRNKINNKQTRCNNMHDMVLMQMQGCSNASLSDLNDPRNYSEIIYRSHALFICWKQAKSSMFNHLEWSDMRTEGIFKFVSFFWSSFIYKIFSSDLRINLYDIPKYLIQFLDFPGFILSH